MAKKNKTALSINEGKPQIQSVNAKYRFQKRKSLSIEDYIAGILKSDISVLGQAISLVESNLENHQKLAEEIIRGVLKYSGNSIRIGITGVPGVGKSTFIETFGLSLIQNGYKVAVLAIDPSSEKTHGSILGDKTRMENLSSNTSAFIRPSPSAGSLGGVARKTRETIILCEAAGFDRIIIETVGVGQSETQVHSMVDIFLLLMLAGAGDELQGIKRGIMEMADILAITKCDQQNIEKASLAKAEYKNALHLFPPTESGWIPPVLTCSSIENSGIKEIIDQIDSFINFHKTKNLFQNNRSKQTYNQMIESLKDKIESRLLNEMALEIKESKDRLINNVSSPFEEASRLFNLFNQLD